MNDYHRFIEGDPGEFLVAGPPGSGKTYWIVKMIERALGGQLYDPTDITLASFTRTAAYELRKRVQAKGFEVPEDSVGTLHSLAYRLLDRPAFALSKENLTEWNRKYPHFALSPLGRLEELDVEEKSDSQETHRGDALLRRYNHFMNALLPLPAHETLLTEFVHAWTEHKRQMGVLDFVDIIHKAIEHELPPSFGMLFFDECQDFSPLELKLAHTWARHADRTAYIGDDDQCIYGNLKGTQPSTWLIDLPDERRLILNQSYRLPRAVHMYCAQLTQRITDGRWAKEFKPKVEPGMLNATAATHQDLGPMLAVLQQNEVFERPTMLLAYTNHMVSAMVKQLRAAGLMYHNPFRPTNGAWNPLGARRKGSITSLEKLCAFARPQKTQRDVLKFGSLLQAKGVFKHGQKAQLERELEAYRSATEAEPYQDGPIDLEVYFTPQAIEAIQKVDWDWFQANTKTTPALEYAMDLVLRKGPEVEQLKPQIIVGTIHSVKGGEARHVMVMPDVGVNLA